MRRERLALAGLLIVIGSLAGAEPHVSGKVSEVMVQFPPEGVTLSAGPLVWAGTVTPPVAIDAGQNTRVRIRFSDLVLPQGDDFRIEIADGNGQVHDVLDRARLADREMVWSMFIPGVIVSVRVRGLDAVDDLAFVIDRVLFPFTAVAVESFFGPGQLTDIVEYRDEHADIVKAVATSVAKIEYVVDAQSDSCTAFRVDADLIQTSAHCVATPALCDTAIAQFGFQKNEFGAFDRGQQVRCVEVVAQQGGELADTAILRVTPLPEDQYGIAEFREADPGENEPLFIVQHPGGEVKKVSIVDCAVFDNEETAAHPHGFGHSCDTKAGSSGSPVFDLEGRVVGQQRAGHRNPAVTDQPNLATFGSLLRLTSMAADAPPSPRGVEAGPDAARGSVPGGAIPLPLPVAPDQPAQDDAAVPGGPSVSSPGSGGTDSILSGAGQ